jgi:hypothetical protein
MMEKKYKKSSCFIKDKFMCRKNYFLMVLLVLLMPLILASCLFPEEFKASVDINKNGSFSFTYDGILTFVVGRAAEVQGGKLSPKMERDLKKLQQELAKDKAFKKVEYLGHSKFHVLFKKEGSLDKPFYITDKDTKIFSIIPGPGGLIEVKGMKLSKKDIRQLEALDLQIDGELTVKTDAEVIEQNAGSTPGLFGLWGGYHWKITSINVPQPRILIKIK